MTTPAAFDQGGYRPSRPGRHPSGRSCRGTAVALAVPVLPLLLVLLVLAIVAEPWHRQGGQPVTGWRLGVLLALAVGLLVFGLASGGPR